MIPRIVHQCFQLALKVEEKLKKKHDASTQGRGRGRDGIGHRGNYDGRRNEPITQGESILTEHTFEPSGRGSQNIGKVLVTIEANLVALVEDPTFLI